MSERLRAWARRHGAKAAGNAVNDLRAGEAPEAVAAKRGLPLATVRGVAAFYDQLGGGRKVCDGTACHFAAGTGRAGGEVRCLGHCYAAPTWIEGETVYAGEHPAPPIPRRSLVETPAVLRRLRGEPGDWRDAYDLPDGATVLAAVEASGLRGRGGAAYPTAAKWRAARDTPAAEKYVVANGDEGDPGSYIDRLLLEEDPHAVLAGMLACSRAIGARRGIIYIRAEYPAARAAVRRAIDEARAAGFLGDHFAVEALSGAGSYVCGEETALLNSIEGFRGEPRPKPPYPAQSGLFGLPTVVQNVETLSLLPWIARTGRGAGTKAFCLSGAVARPGVVEAPLGTPLSRLLHEGGGGPPEGRRWKLALIGGPLGRVLPESAFDTPLSFDALPGMGHAGIVALDDTVSIRELARHLFAFARIESCGTCAPCRIGTAQLERIRDRGALERLLTTLEMGSLCGFGQGVPRPVRDLLAHFGEEVLQ